MSSKVQTVAPDDRLERVCEILASERCHHVPVVDQRKPVGMVSTQDLLHLAAS